MADNYSIWIKPAAGHMFNKLQQEIATQAKELEAPLFEPHVTLLPDIQGDKEQIIATMQQLAQAVKVSRQPTPTQQAHASSYDEPTGCQCSTRQLLLYCMLVNCLYSSTSTYDNSNMQSNACK
jgi:hypothetical protein